MNEKVTFEMNENNKTGTECSETGTYCCHLHSYLESHINQGEIFPKCGKGTGHNTIWWKKIK